MLLFVIMTGKGSDIGRVIHSSITPYLMGGTSGGIPYAALITRLFLVTEVQWDASESVQISMSTIDHVTI